MSNRSHVDPSRRGVAGFVIEAHRGVGRGLALALLAGTAGCAASPQYPIRMGERAGDGTIMSAQPRYAVSAQDAAQNAADRRSQGGYPAYGAPPMSDAPAPQGAAPDPATAAAPPSAPADDMADDAPQPASQSSGAVDSTDLPPPGAAPASPPPSGGDAPVPPADPAASPHEVSYAYGGGRVVFGLDWVVAPQVELAAYRHRRHVAASQSAAADSSASADTATPSRRRGRHVEAAAGDEAAPVSSHAAADTPYQTVVKPGETLGDVAERIHSSRAALTELNDLKHPRHVKAGTVLKIPYRYSYEVQKGDTLYTIAHRFSQDPAEIAKLNGLKTVPTLQPGQAIQLPPGAADQGKRDHASASGPAPEAAPAKLADAALRKIERHSRRSRTAELNTAEAALPPQEIRRSGRRGAANAEAGPAPSAPEKAAVAPEATPPATPSVASTVPVEPARRAVVAAVPTVSRPYTPPASPPYAYARAPATAAATTASSLGAASTTSRPLAPASVAAASAASGGATAYRPSAAAPSTYVAPGYAARAASAPTQQYANVTPPRYTPGYPATGANPATPYTPSLGRERTVAPALSGGAATAADIASAARGRFIWPLRGAVVSGFGAKGTGEYNNGMDISAQPGAAVRAAAAGDVVYAGSSIPGYGNMVLIKHPGGWVTAYAHLNRIEVRMHDTVAQGDEIGQAGQTGVVDRPELYFEVRYAASAADRPRPVDPALVLPAGGG